MTKSELINELAQQMPQIPIQDIDAAVDAFFNGISAALVKRERIEIRGLGSFFPRKRKERNARNPKTGAAVKVESKYVPRFLCGRELRERLNPSEKT